MVAIPSFQLSLGQLAWTLNHGRPADARMRNELRYLRRVGIPHDEDDVSEGRGNRILYGFEELIECGVAQYAIRRGIKIADVAQILIRERKKFKRLYRETVEKLPDSAFVADWVKSRGKIITFIQNECFLRIHDRYSSKSSTYQLILPGTAIPGGEVFGLHEIIEGDEARVLVPLVKLTTELVAWAKDAPQIRPGRP